MRAPHPRLAGGGANLEPRWRPGSEGQQAVAGTVSARCGDRVIALHDRIASHHASVDHLLVARSGIWVVDSLVVRGRVELATPPAGDTTVLVNGHDRTDRITALLQEVELVTSAMDQIEPAVQVRGVLCVVTPKGPMAECALPALRPMAVGELPVMTPQRLTEHLLDEGFLSPMNRTRIARALAQRFPQRAVAR